MGDIIKLLPDSVANQIAAGEVIQRPASVIKELVENSVDAGATDIRVFVKDAGRTLIQVVDNGKGMSETDARMAFERHATSKIRGADDLFSLHTMGFRGEALPSISAISQIEMKTKVADAAIGTRLQISGSVVETQEACVCDSGTNIMVKNIFFNVPARRKFLKSDNVELSNIMREFERLALVNNNIRMSIDTGTRILDLRPGTFKQRIGDIWKNNLDLHLLPIEVETSLIKISGFVSRPEFARRRNPLQYLIVNGRNMRHPRFHGAIMRCYDALIASDTQPCYFLKFEVDPASIDVNIHPTKHEIKFEFEQEILPILHASVKAALGKFGAVPSIDFNSEILPVDPLPPGVEPEKPQLDIPENYNPFTMPASGSAEIKSFPSSSGSFSTGSQGWSKSKDRVPRNWDTLYADFVKGPRNETPEESVFGKDIDAGAGAICVQHALRFIVTSTREGLMIIDQHRAHVKILYDKYLKKVEQGEQVAQPTMFPDSLTLSPEQQEALQEGLDELSKLGFTLEYEEEDRWRITSVPVMLKDADPKDVVLKILDSIIEYGSSAADTTASSDLLSRMALVMARSSAVKGGRKLSTEEMEHLIGELFSLEEPAYTPTGNPVYKILDIANLDSMFK